MDDRRHDNPGRPFSVINPEELERVENYFTENPKASLRVAGQILGILRLSLHVIISRFLKLHPYKIHQALTETHMEK